MQKEGLMANAIFRNRLTNSIEAAIRESENASAVAHAGLQGRIREAAAQEIFRPMLPFGFEIGTGKICDSAGGQSPETDLIIHNRTILPPVMYGDRDGIFPVESCFYAIEVKTKLTAETLKDALDKGRRILELAYEIQVPSDRAGQRAVIKPVLLALFAFGSDLSSDGLNEIERYSKFDPQWKSSPILRVICVIGRGYWHYQSHLNGWVFHGPTDERDEVIDFVSGTMNSLVKKLAQRSGQQLGRYLMIPRSAKLVT
jgi:hypothetical protein